MPNSKSRTARFSMRTMILAIAVIALGLAYFREPINRMLLNATDPTPLELIRNERELQEMLSVHRSVVFVNADWSMSSKMVRMNLVPFAREWRQQHGREHVKFFEIDVTDENPSLDIARWSKTDPKLGLIQAGSGSVIWLRNGDVLKREDPTLRNVRNTLSRQTTALFGFP